MSINYTCFVLPLEPMLPKVLARQISKGEEEDDEEEEKHGDGNPSMTKCHLTSAEAFGYYLLWDVDTF